MEPMGILVLWTPLIYEDSVWRQTSLFVRQEEPQSCPILCSFPLLKMYRKYLHRIRFASSLQITRKVFLPRGLMLIAVGAAACTT